MDDVTVAEAAELLNVSERYLLDRIESGDLSLHLVGERRALRRTDVLAYRDKMDDRAEAALTALTAETEALGLLRRVGQAAQELYRWDRDHPSRSYSASSARRSPACARTASIPSWASFDRSAP